MIEFVDTNVFVYAYDSTNLRKHQTAADLLVRLSKDENGALSVQILVELYAAGQKKLGLSSLELEEIMSELGLWKIHRPSHADILRACELHRRFQVSWWDALVVNSAIELGCTTLWSEDLNYGQQYGPVTVRNPFA